MRSGSEGVRGNGRYFSVYDGCRSVRSGCDRSCPTRLCPRLYRCTLLNGPGGTQSNFIRGFREHDLWYWCGRPPSRRHPPRGPLAGSRVVVPDLRRLSPSGPRVSCRSNHKTVEPASSGLTHRRWGGTWSRLTFFKGLVWETRLLYPPWPCLRRRSLGVGAASRSVVDDPWFTGTRRRERLPECT